MSHSNKRLSIALVVLFALSFVPVGVSADGGQTPPPSYAFLPDWTQSMGGTLDPSGEAVDNGMEFTNHGFDEEGNLYHVQTEDYVNWLNGSYTASQKGFHILKMDVEGNFEYSEVIKCSNYCASPDYSYSKVIGLHVVEEDTFYAILSVYNDYLTFGNDQNYAGSYNIVTAYYENGTWAWIDIEPTSGWAHSNVLYHGVDEGGSLYLVTKGQRSGSWQEYAVNSYGASGANWVRSLEVPYESPSYNYYPLLFDVNASGLHVFATVPDLLSYDSQYVNCPTGGEEGHCHVWMNIDHNGVRSSEVAVPYTSIFYKQMSVANGTLHLMGHTQDYVSGSNTESNFTGQKISHSPRYGHYYAVLNSSGTWDDHLVFNQPESNNIHTYAQLVEVLDDGSVLLRGLFTEPTNVDGTMVTHYTNVDYEVILMRYHSVDGLLWSESIGYVSTSPSLVDMRSDGSTVVYQVTHSSNSNYGVYYEYNGVTTGSPQGVYNHELLWFDVENGEIVDVETTPALINAAGRDFNGGVLASGTNTMHFFMPDFDGDNVGSDDNCPDVYNPSQSDYNNNGIGDACDEDDDSDGVEDFSDSCPLGANQWQSTDLTDVDGDGCKDNEEEDMDDDNDGIQDLLDACPIGIVGAGSDLDGDGCKDVEDADDDGDNVRDESDICSTGDIDWSSGSLTDHDADGCRDEGEEDLDDDNDGVADSIDACARGSTDWPSNINTDFDADGCRDGFEDEDDDGDGIANPIDDCPQSVGAVNTNGCSATQTLDGDGGDNTVYYVCPSGGLVVLDPADCPMTSNNQSTPPDSPANDTFYFVCPGGSDVVTDLSECEGSIVQSGSNLTIVVDPSSNNSNDYFTCDGGRIIVLDRADCPDESNQPADSASSEGEASQNDTMLMLVGGTFAMSAVAMIVVLVRRPTSAPTFLPVDSTDHMFKEPQAEGVQKTPPALTPPPTSNNQATQTLSAPSKNLIGRSHEGQEWLEWPEGADQHWYRDVGFGGEWTKYER